MTSDSGKAVSYFRDVFPELAAMPDAVLVVRVEKLRRIEDDIHCLDRLDASDAARGAAGDAVLALGIVARGEVSDDDKQTPKMQAETWGQRDDRAAANETAVIAMERAINSYRRLGSAATVNALADELYAIGDGTEAAALTTIAKDLWQLAAAMKA